MALISTGVSTEIASVYSHTLKLVQNDTLPQLIIALTDKTDSSAIDLTNVATILVKLKPLGGTAVKVSMPAYRNSPFTSGNMFLDFPAGALDTTGVFTAEIELTYSSGRIQTVFDELKFEVRGEY
jgi:hypothetical protein